MEDITLTLLKELSAKMEIDIVSKIELAIANENNPRLRREMNQVLAETLKKVESRLK